jgi:hypothetical protein
MVVPLLHICNTYLIFYTSLGKDKIYILNKNAYTFI